jgi:putative salt-induced outer membrane protein
MAIRLVAVSAAAITALTWPSSAFAELPVSVRAMIDAAIATGDKAKVATVIELARQTNPRDGSEIDAIEAAYNVELAQREKEKAAAAEQAIRQAGVFDNWGGKGELGASRSSGNSDTFGVTFALTLERKGIDWSHKVRTRADYQRSNGVRSREQLFASYEPRYQIDDGLFTYGLAQFERDPLQGFSGRYALSGGLGYNLIDREDLDLAVKTGPAYRVTTFVDGGSETGLAGLVGLDFDWRLNDRLSLTQDANAVTATAGGQATAIFGAGSTSVNLVTGLNAKISDHFGARLSYAVDYDSNPPDGAVSTDTLSRVTVVYDF